MNLRTHISKQGTLFLAGRTDENNEELISQVQPEEFVFHTEAAGSPFVNIKGSPKEGDTKEAAIMCARYSRDWKKNKTDIIIHEFKGKDISKSKYMKTGTFGVKKAKPMKIKKESIESFKSNPAKKGQLMEFEKEGLIELKTIINKD
jgi:predicted ribosome quality control (RQC) complex YloA/Tae2 family protein